MTFGTSEQTRRLVEVTALQALSKIYMNRNLLPKIAECEKKLREFAFPLSIDFQNAPLGILEGQCPKCNRTKCNDGTLPALLKNDKGIWCNRCQGYLE